MRRLKRFVVCCVACALLFSLAPLAWGDTVVLKDGKALQGTFKGGDAANIQFEVDGKLQTLAVAAKGAAVALLAPGNHIKIPAGTLVEVTLKSDVKMP